jgi:hypothetical protein
MFDMDLLYVKYRQQELWQEAAAQSLAAAVQPASPPWRHRVLHTLKSLVAGFPWWLSRSTPACPVPAVVRVAQPRRGGNR